MQQPNTDNRQAVMKTSLFGGFDKKEVLQYIDRLREENAAAESELDRRLQEVIEARDALDSQVAGFEQKLAQMGGELDERSSRILELTDEINRLKSELQVTAKDNAETNRALTLQKEQNRLLLERGRENEEKARRYQRVSEQLGDIMLTAQHDADEIIIEARGEAERIKSDANNASQRVTKELLALRGELACAREKMNNVVEEFAGRINAIERIIDSIDPAVEAAEAASAPAVEEQMQKAPAQQPAAKPNEKSRTELPKPSFGTKPSQEREIARVVSELERKRQNPTGKLLGRFLGDR